VSRLTPRVPLSAEVRHHVVRRAVTAFLSEQPGCGVWEAEPCECGCSTLLRTTCPDWDPTLVFIDPRRPDTAAVLPPPP
jgi:hypothetical protein